ncbi:putative Tyrosine-protein phosphatase precursor [Leifsonia rubra CMS 76R]|nr:putative Tyrosine-protein phosphatase precursor [Leifsonia rubra CMS 76R]
MDGLVMWNLHGTYNLRRAANEPWLYRSAALDHLQQDDIDTLRANEIGLVIDLREHHERRSAATSITTTHIPIYDLPDGPPQSGTLSSIYDLMLFDRGCKLGSAVSAIARSETPVLVHCTAGKDRTGLVVALALHAAGLNETAVVDDYAASGSHVRPHRHDLVTKSLAALELGGDQLADALELHLDSPAAALLSALAEIRTRFGSINEYLLAHGVTLQDLAALRERRMAKHA